MLKLLAAPSATATAALTSGSPSVTVADTTALEGALKVKGTGIPRGTLVQSIDSPTQLTLTANATATTAAATLSFTLEPVMLDEAKTHLRVDIPNDDRLIAGLIATARQLAETALARSFLSTRWRLRLDQFPVPSPGLDPRGWTPLFWSFERLWPGMILPIRLPRADLLSVESLSIVDPSGATVVVDPSQYTADVGCPGRIVPAYGATWPAARNQPGGVTVDFTCGYGPTAEDVPDPIRSAVLLYVGHLYNNREATVTAAIGLKEMPLGVCSLLATEDWGYYS